MDIRDRQAWLKAHGYDPGPIDGLMGPKTEAAWIAFESDGRLWPQKGLWRIVMHWSAGLGWVTKSDAKHYHTITSVDGKTVLTNKPEINRDTSDGNYCAHTRALNTGSIGMAMAGMMNAEPHDPVGTSDYPLTAVQLDRFCEEVADMADTYGIPITLWTVLTHAEVQPTLGVRQRNKWDITWLPGMDKAMTDKPVSVGNHLRRLIRAAI